MRLLTFGIALAGAIACGDAASDDSDGPQGPDSSPNDNRGGSDPTGAGGGNQNNPGAGSGAGEPTTNPLAVVFPTDLAFASPTLRSATVGQTDTTGRGLRVQRQTLTSAPPSAYEAKIERLAAILSGVSAADCDFQFDLTRLGPGATCYGPGLTYTNHPGAPSPDADSTDSDTGFSDLDGDGSLPTGDLGLWQSTEGASSEACAAATLNARVGEVEAQADSAVFAMASMICLANVSGASLPADGSAVDLTSLVASGFTSNGSSLTVSTASISESDGVYTSVLEASTSAGTAQRIFCRLRHRNSSNGVTYTGKLSCVIESDTGMKFGNCNQPDVAAGETDALSIAYQKNSSSIFTYELRSANYCGNTGVDPWVSSTDFTVDPTKKLNLPMDPGTDDLDGWGQQLQPGAVSVQYQCGRRTVQLRMAGRYSRRPHAHSERRHGKRRSRR